MVNSDVVVGTEVVEQTVGTAIEVVAGDYRRVWFYEAGDDIEGGHARRNRERMRCGVDFREMVLYEMRCGESRMSYACLRGAHDGENRAETDPDAILWGYRSLCSHTLQIRP